MIESFNAGIKEQGVILYLIFFILVVVGILFCPTSECRHIKMQDSIEASMMKLVSGWGSLSEGTVVAIDSIQNCFL